MWCGLRGRTHCSGRHRDHNDVRFRSRTDQHITGGFYLFRQVGAVRPQHTCALWGKKRDASTDPLRRLHAHMVQHNVDFIGCDFNMSACSTVGDVFTDSEFAGTWHLAALCPKRPCEWRVDAHGFCNANSTTLISDSGPATPRPTLPSFFTCAPPTSLLPTVLRAVNLLNSGGMERAAGRSKRQRHRRGLT